MRQYRFVFLHDPKSWATATAVLWAPPICLVLALPVLVSGSIAAWIALALGIGLGETRLRVRRSIERALWPVVGASSDPGRWRAERLMRPVWWMVHALSAAGAPLSRRVDWAGIRYRVDRPQFVVIEAREAPR